MSKENKLNITPLQDRILIKEITDHKEKKTSSGIIIPAGSDEDKSTKQGEVIAVGPGKTEDGKIVVPTVKIGNKVLFQWGDKIKYNDNEYYIVRESEIMAIIK